MILFIVQDGNHWTLQTGRRLLNIVGYSLIWQFGIYNNNSYKIEQQGYKL
jgi:hypothetical protein